VPVGGEPPPARILPIIDLPLAAVEPTEAWDATRFSLFGEIEP
jgi:hypothetical protein